MIKIQNSGFYILITGVLFFFIFMMSSCAENNIETIKKINQEILIANVEDAQNDIFLNIKSQFEKNNPGYSIQYIVDAQLIEKNDENRIAFIQKGSGTIDMNGHATSKFSVGDVLVLRPADQMYADSLFSALVISSPVDIPRTIPPFIRPDWDHNITDIPGGCATETNAYRRILLTWKESIGKYVYHGVNAHRVRIMDSFTHYHPKNGGFDEFYLVQMAAPTAKILVSHYTDVIENSKVIKEEELNNLIQSYPLQVGDLVYLPRGVIHRGLGNVLVQVITVPGFIPGAEIGVDHHLDSLDRQFKNVDIPFNAAASRKEIIK